MINEINEIEKLQKQAEYICNGDYNKCYYYLRNKATNSYMNKSNGLMAYLYLKASNKYNKANINHGNRQLHGMFTDMYRH